MELQKNQVLDVLEKVLLEEKNPSIYFQKLRENNKLLPYFKEIKSLIGVKQSPIYHAEGDVFTHTMMVIDEAAKIRDKAEYPFYFMISALCHDFGKTITTTMKNSKIISYNHDKEGVKLVCKFLDRMGADKDLKTYVVNMTEFHMQPNQLARQSAKLKSTNRLFEKSICPHDLVLLATADGRGRISGNGDHFANSYFNESYLNDALEKFKKEQK